MAIVLRSLGPQILINKGGISQGLADLDESKWLITFKKELF